MKMKKDLKVQRENKRDGKRNKDWEEVRGRKREWEREEQELEQEQRERERERERERGRGALVGGGRV